MIKIASIVPYQIIPPEHGGHRGIYNFYEALSNFAEITCFTVTENLAWKNENIRIVPVLGSNKNKFRYINPFLIYKIKTRCRHEGIHLLILEHPYFGWLGYALQKLFGLKYAVHSYNIESIRFKTMRKKWWKILYGYEKFTHRHAVANFFITEEDRQFAIRNYSLNEDLCYVATYGIEEEESPSKSEKDAAHLSVCKELGLNPSTILLMFNGSLDYVPNKTAVVNIIHNINPLLKTKLTAEYKIIICGRAEPDMAERLASEQANGIIYPGFVNDIRQYFLATDVFLNPVTEGGGIKTKLVEALAADTPSVSFKSGAWGLPPEVTGDALKIVNDDDFSGFTDVILKTLNDIHTSIPVSFYNHFNQKKIAEKVAGIIAEVISLKK